MNLDRQQAPNPYDFLPPVPSFTLKSDDLTDGATMPDLQLGFGDNISPHLAWEGFPDETKSFVVTCFDPDAPTLSGFWHWFVIDLNAGTTELERGAGQSDLFLPNGASHLRNDASEWAYYGAAPPPSDPPHRYIFTVHALDSDFVEVDPETASLAVAFFDTMFHTIARAHLTVTFGR